MEFDLLAVLRDRDRLRALAESELMDSPAEERFDQYTKLAATILNVPAALVSLVDDHRQFFKSAYGLGEPWATLRETPLSHSFCKHAVASGEPLIVEDAPHHPVVRENRAIPELGVLAYAGVPLEDGGQTLGVFCVVDNQPRKWTPQELATIRALAAAVTSEIALARTKREVQERDALMSALTDSALDVIVTMDGNGEIVFCNRATEVVFGRPQNSLLGMPVTTLMPERYRAAHRAGLARVEAGGEPRVLGKVVELQGLRADGEEFPVELSISRWAGRGGQFYTAVLRDVTERVRAAQALRATEEQLRLVVEHAPIGMAVAALDGKWLRANDAMCEITGYARDELLKIDFQTITYPEDLDADLALVGQLIAGEIPHYNLEKRYVHKQGHILWVLISVSLVRTPEGAPSFFVAQVQDITARREMEEQLRQTSLVDELTNLQNRRGFMLLGEQQLSNAARYGRSMVVLFADLNGMKQINDQLGHDVGDQALVAMADVLRTTFRRADIIARLGGDEFVVLAEGDREFSKLIEKRVQKNVELFNERGTHPFELSVSLGVTAYAPDETKNLGQLLQSADKLMYDAKRRMRASAPQR